MNHYRAKSPALLTVFNRPHNLKKRLNQILQYQPPRIYIAVDGPRAGNSKDQAANQEIIQFLENYAGHSSIHTLLQPKNLGARKGMVAALSWFFDLESEGVIIEDDIDFSAGFFPFMDHLLALYRESEQIGGVNGWNPLHLWDTDPNSYFLTKYPFIYGWGAWRRTWNKYLDSLNQSITSIEFGDTPLMTRSNSPEIDQYWRLKFAGVAAGHIDTWDFQLCYAAWKNHLLFICPARSQTRNVGLDASRVRRFRQQVQSNELLEDTNFAPEQSGLVDLDVDSLFDGAVFGFPPDSNNRLRLAQVELRRQLEKSRFGRRLLR